MSNKQTTGNQIVSLLRDGRLLRSAWTGTDKQGREMVCLLAAISPQCGKNKSASFCPAEKMPEWMAHLTVSINDNGSPKAWRRTVTRYADLIDRWHVLTPEAWERVRVRFILDVLSKSRRCVDTKATDVLAAIDGVISMYNRVRGGGEVAAEEWAMAKAETTTEEWAAWAAWAKAEAEAWEAEAKAKAKTKTKTEAWEAKTKAWAAWAVAKAWEAKTEAWAKAWEAWDEMTTVIFDFIEAEIVGTENANINKEKM